MTNVYGFIFMQNNKKYHMQQKLILECPVRYDLTENFVIKMITCL